MYLWNMGISNEIKRSVSTFGELCKSHKVSRLYAFGSSVTDSFDPELSDIDLVVEIEESNPLNRGELLLSLWDKLEVFFGRKVDLLTEGSIRNPFLKKNIDATKVLIYDGPREKVLI